MLRRLDRALLNGWLFALLSATAFATEHATVTLEGQSFAIGETQSRYAEVSKGVPYIPLIVVRGAQDGPVGAGALLGTVRYQYGARIAELRAPEAGVVVMLRHTPPFEAGSGLVTLGIVRGAD